MAHMWQRVVRLNSLSQSFNSTFEVTKQVIFCSVKKISSHLFKLESTSSLLKSCPFNFKNRQLFIYFHLKKQPGIPGPAWTSLATKKVM